MPTEEPDNPGLESRPHLVSERVGSILQRPSDVIRDDAGLPDEQGLTMADTDRAAPGGR